MTEGTTDGAERACTRCGETVPVHRSVCPACGALQAGRRDPAGPAGPPRRVVPRTIAPPGAPTPLPPIAAPPAVSDHVARDRSPRGRRRSPWPAIVAVLVALGVIGGVVAGGIYLDRRDRDEAEQAELPADGSDPRPDLVRGYCDDPRPLTGPGEIATFTPGQGTVAYAELPQPASATEPPGEVVLQVSPAIGRPGLELDASIDLVSLAVCVEEAGREAIAEDACTYEHTEAGAVGEQEAVDLAVTTFEAQIIELRTGKVLSEGTFTTSDDGCPELAFLDVGGVSNLVSEDDLVGWISQHLVGGIPT